MHALRVCNREGCDCVEGVRVAVWLWHIRNLSNESKTDEKRETSNGTLSTTQFLIPTLIISASANPILPSLHSYIPFSPRIHPRPPNHINHNNNKTQTQYTHFQKLSNHIPPKIKKKISSLVSSNFLTLQAITLFCHSPPHLVLIVAHPLISVWVLQSHMMGTAAVIGLSAGKRLLASSHHYSDVAEKLSSCCVNDVGFPHYPSPPTKNIVSAKKPSNFAPSSSNRSIQAMKALKEHVESSASAPSTEDPDSFSSSSSSSKEVEDEEYLVEAFLLLQKSMLEKQWNLSFDGAVIIGKGEEKEEDMEKKAGGGKRREVTCSGTSARQRRMSSRKRFTNEKSKKRAVEVEMGVGVGVGPLGIENGFSFRGYVKGVVSEELLTHAQVVHLSNKIKAGLLLEDHKSRMKERLGSEPTDEQVAASLRISRAELQSKLIECSLAREKLAMSNVRLVMSIAQRYDNMGAEMADLVQGGLIGLLRGIEKFDSSKGFKISTYVYWWIRQGVSRALVENSRTLRLPSHLHERLNLIRNAKIRLEEKGITPSIDRIAECLNMSQKKVRNATEAISKVFSLDREAFPSLNGLPGETLHSYIADVRLENNPWHGVDEWTLKDEVNKLINMTLGERERDIIRLYYGLDNECLTWEDISKRIGLSRERVRQVGLVALEKLKHAARKNRMEALLVKY